MDGGAFLLIVLTVLAALLLLAIAGLAFRWVRGQAGERCVVPCGIRSEPGRWTPGLLRYDHQSLDLAQGRGRGTHTVATWRRVDLDLGRARVLPQDEAGALRIPGAATAVDVQVGEARFELALGIEHYTALRSWTEAVPPGWNANVA